MRTTVDIPAALFHAATRAAKLRGITRSRLFETALREHLQRARGDEVTAALDRVYAAVDSSPDPLVEAEALRQLAKSEWESNLARSPRSAR